MTTVHINTNVKLRRRNLKNAVLYIVDKYGDEIGLSSDGICEKIIEEGLMHRRSSPTRKMVSYVLSQLKREGMVRVDNTTRGPRFTLEPHVHVEVHQSPAPRTVWAELYIDTIRALKLSDKPLTAHELFEVLTDHGKYKGHHLTEEEYVTRVISPLSCQGYLEEDESGGGGRRWGYREHGLNAPRQHELR